MWHTSEISAILAKRAPTLYIKSTSVKESKVNIIINLSERKMMIDRRLGMVQNYTSCGGGGDTAPKGKQW